MIRSKRTQGGFTLVFTIFLIAILTTLGVAINLGGIVVSIAHLLGGL